MQVLARAPARQAVLDDLAHEIGWRRMFCARESGWKPSDYQAWSDRLLGDGAAFVVPTSWAGETVLRLCLVNPSTTVEHIAELIGTLA